MSWIDLGPIEAIPLPGARKLRTVQGDIAVFRTGTEEVFATDDRAQPKGGPLSEGIVHGTSVACPILNWIFDLTTGEAVGEAARVQTYAVKIENGHVLIDATATSRSAA